VEQALQQLERYIAAMSAADREAAVAIIRKLGAVLDKYPLTLTPAAALKFIGALGVAHAGGTTDKFWRRVAEKAAATGPHVGAIFQAR
jgi:hypothetical protein